jgi:hypothetical protein
MNHYSSKTNRTQMTLRWLSLSFLLVALLGFSKQVAAQQPVPWTAVASTGAVDEESLNRYAATASSITYRAASQSLDPIQVRYNVTDLSLMQPIPGWTHLELGSVVPGGGSFVSATLFRVDRCTGEQQELCTTTNDGGPNPADQQPRCTTCEFPANAINFSFAAGYLYYVRVTLDRNDQPDPPSALTLRLF